MKTILMTGVCGVGKSTLSSEFSQSIGCSWGDYADIMLEVMSEDNKDKIQYLERTEKAAIIEKAELLVSQRFVNTSTNDTLHIFENHLSIIQDGEVVTFPLSDYERYNTIGLVVVEALSRVILSRRKSDAARNRLIKTEDLIDEQQKINLEEAEKVSSHLKIPCLRIVNDDKNSSIAALTAWYSSLERAPDNHKVSRTR